VSRNDDLPTDDVLRAVGRFLARASEGVAAARTNQHQWTSLRPGLLPVDPEALAMSALTAMTWQDALKGDLSDSLTTQLDRADLVPLFVAERILARSS